MPSPNAIAAPPSIARFRPSTVNSRLFCLNSFRIIYICKNASSNPYGSHIYKTKDLKSFRITYFQKKGTGGGGLARPLLAVSEFPVSDHEPGSRRPGLAGGCRDTN